MTDAEIAEKTPAQLLYDACKAGDAEAVRAAPADVAVAAKSDAGKPALAAAAEAQHGAVVDALLAHGVADGASAGFWSAAMYAAWNGDAAILGALLKAGDEVGAGDDGAGAAEAKGSGRRRDGFARFGKEEPLRTASEGSSEDREAEECEECEKRDMKTFSRMGG